MIGFEEGGGGTDEVYAFSHSSSITLMATDRLHAVSRGKGAECCGWPIEGYPRRVGTYLEPASDMPVYTYS